MKRTVKDIDIKNKKVIIRCDFNVPIKNNKILDDTRILRSLQTINYCIEENAKIILMSHLGRVKEESDLIKNDLILVAERLSSLLNKNVVFVNKTRGKTLEQEINKLNGGDILLIQNTRYEDYPNQLESKCDLELSKYWASLGEVFINDAFGTIHRAHASNVGISNILPSCIGFLVEKELSALEILNNPNREFTVIFGGSKVSDKIGVIENIVTKADKILIGGGMAFTFLKAKNINVGKSLVEEEYIDFCKKILNDNPDKIYLPTDVLASNEISELSISRITKIENIREDEMGLDIGPETIEEWTNILDTARTVLWNGPLGVYEILKFRNATLKILDKVSKINAHTILGGGDIVACATTLGYDEKVSHASTGGGATLEYLEGKKLPGLECIEERS